MTLKIRPATSADALNLAALSIQVWLHTYALEGIRTAISEYVLAQYTPAQLLQWIQDPDQRLFVAEKARHLVGYARLHLASPAPGIPSMKSELCTLYVQEHSHRGGIGTALLEVCEQTILARQAVNDLWLSCYHGNARALAFYHRQGLRPCGSFDFEFGGESHLNHVLARPAALAPRPA